MDPHISIITPSFNQGKYIGRTIESVLTQDVDGLEYMVIDGGSTDETVDVLKGYGDRFFWLSEKDQGHSDAINKGVLRSKAPIIGWLNSDDIYYPGALKAVVEFFDQNPDVDVAYGNANHIDENDQFINEYPTEDFNWERLLDTCFISQPATFVRRRVFEKHGLLDLSLRQSMDYEFWIRLGKGGAKFARIPKLLAATRLHKDAFTVAATMKCHYNINVFMLRHFGRVPDNWVFNYAHAWTEKKGIKREQRYKFAVVVGLASVATSLRWNKRISRRVFTTAAKWTSAGVKGAIKRTFGKNGQ
jgi:glycosyltransferase involved in cell wall biosynthesis